MAAAQPAVVFRRRGLYKYPRMSAKKHKGFVPPARPDKRTGSSEESDLKRCTGRRWEVWLLLLALLLATLAAYHPAWHGGMLWDDDGHVTRSGLRSTAGLWRIWFDVGATQQYYPVLHSVFWVLHRLWGDDTLGYHLVNIALHVLSAFLLALIMRRLAVPGATLAALIFALHPVQVESVAWISEMKNTLSVVFYLSAALAYLRFDQRREKRLYALALALFLLALLSKTVTATLPAALLVVFWWQRGRLDRNRDVMPLVPFFALGAAGGLVTVWVERALIGAQGAEFSFTLIERCLIAGRAIWFYLGKLIWPSNLIFIYPRWQVSQGLWWQYLYPLGAIALLAALWFLRKRSRGPLAAMLLFCGTLFPALGFVNVFPFRFSFVADHFQYLASIAIVALFAAGVAGIGKRWNVRPRAAAAVTLAVGGALAFATWRQSHLYVDSQTLYRATISRNPSCWLAYNNLGVLRLLGPDAGGNVREAIADIMEALRLNPDYPDAHNNMGYALREMGRFEEAMAHDKEALRLAPNFAEAHNNLGIDFQKLGRVEEAIAQFSETLRLNPDFAAAHNNLGDVLQKTGRLQEALAHHKEALRLDPDSAEAHNGLGTALQRMGQIEEGIKQYEQALRLKPDFADAHNNLGNGLREMGRFEEAVAQHYEALRLKPDFTAALYNLGNTFQAMGRYEEAVKQYRETLRMEPDFAEAHNNLGTALEGLGRLDEAVAQYQEVLRLNPDSAEGHNNLGHAMLALGRPGEAVVRCQEALQLRPGYVSAHYNLGNAFQEMGLLEEAVAHYREVLKQEPGSPETHNNLGVALQGLGRLEEAITHFQEALRLKPDFPEARTNLNRALAARKAGKRPA